MTALGKITILWPFEGGISSDTYLFDKQLNQKALGLPLKHILWIKLFRICFGVFGWGPSFAFSPFLSKYIANYVDNNFSSDSIIVINHPWLGKALKHLKNHKSLYLAHNIESKVIEDSNLGLLRKKILFKYVQKLEKRTAEMSDKVVFISENDLVNSSWNLKEQQIKVIGIGTRTYQQKQIVRERYVVFVGGDYLFNVEAAQEVINLAKQMPNIDFKIVGSVCDHLATSLPNVLLLGWVSESDLADILAAGSIFVNPMKHGSGIHLKLIKAMSFNLPIVTTQVGWRGFEKFSQLRAQIADISEFSEVIQQTLDNYGVHSAAAEANGAFVEKELSWKTVCREFNNFVSDLEVKSDWKYVDPYSISMESMNFENQTQLRWRQTLNVFQRMCKKLYIVN
jgi:glycosyltransferase involved in cell wall biosynthesis